MYSNDDLMKYLLPPPNAAPASATPFNLAQALGLEQRPIGAPPTLGVGQLTPPVAMPAAPLEAPPPTLASMVPSPAAAAPPPRPAPAGPGGGALAGLQRDERSGYAQQAAGIQAEAAAKGKLSQTIGEGELHAAAEQRQRLAADAQADAEANAQIAARRKQLYDQADAIGSTRVDPNRVFAESSTFSKIAGAIAIGIGGYVATQTKGPNVALGMIQKQIDNDIQAQMADLDSRKASLGAKSTLLAQEIASGRNASDARHQATVAAYELAIKETTAQGKMLGTDLAKAEADKLAGALMTDLAQKDKAFWAQQQGLALQGASNAIAQKQLELAQQNQKFTQGLQAGQFARELGKDVTEHADRANALAAHGQLQAAQRAIPLAPIDKAGTPFVAPYGKDEQVTEVNKRLPELTDAIQAVDENIALAKEYSRITDPLKLGEIGQRMSANKAQIASVAHALFGRVNETELEMVLKSAGDPFALIKRTETMKAFRENLRATGQHQLEAIGYKGHWEPPAREAPIGKLTGKNAPPLPPSVDEMMRERFIRSGGDVARGTNPYIVENPLVSKRPEI